MRIRWLVGAALLLTACDGANGAGRAAAPSDVVRYAKQIDVAVLDRSLSSQSLERWLASARLRLRGVQWSRGDCGLRPSEPSSKRDYPLCARIDFREPQAWGWISLKIGTVRTGIGGRPELQHCVVKSTGPPPLGAFHEVKKLSDLPAALDAARRP